MRIMAGNASHLALLEARAFSQIGNLIGYMIIFLMFGRYRSVVVLQLFSRTVAECRTFVTYRIAVTLGTSRLQASYET